MSIQLDPISGDPMPKTNKPAISATQTATPPPFLTADVSSLDAMSRDDLLALCKRMACQCGLVVLLTEEETVQAMLDRLAEIALRPIVPGINLKADISSCMSAIDKWLNRTQGTVAQTINTTPNEVNINVNNVSVTAELPSVAAFLSRFIEGSPEAGVAVALPE